MTGLPDIVILSTDGLDATSLSLYGYGRNTTPFISQLSHESLVFENAFSNSSNTTGSVCSLFTGRLPTRTHVVYPPDVFTGLAAFRHLPGMLRKLGYRTGDVSIRHYADPYDRGLRDAFDFANGQTDRLAVPLLKPLANHFLPQAMFVEHLVDSLAERTLHVFGVKDYFNPYLAVVGVRSVREYFPSSEAERLALKFLHSSEGHPVFLHIHLLGTHGPYFLGIQSRQYSVGQVQTDPWMTDFLDDAVVDFDQFCRRLVNCLKTLRRFDNSILIVTSDHGSEWSSRARIPLIIRFPYGKYRGVQKSNVQTIDLAPTILTVLHQCIPEWMEGDSVFDLKADDLRTILNAEAKEERPVDRGWLLVQNTPPFFSLGAITAVVGNRWYSLNLQTRLMQSGPIQGHTGSFRVGTLPAANEVRRLLVDHLADCGYDVSSLR